jgi:hypothetical protein
MTDIRDPAFAPPVPPLPLRPTLQVRKKILICVAVGIYAAKKTSWGAGGIGTQGRNVTTC